MATPQVSATSTATREALVTTKRQVRTNRGLKKVNSILPAHQAGRRFHSNVVFQQSFTVPTNMFTSTARTTLRLESSQFERAKSICLRFDVAWDAACTVSPIWHWFSRLEWASSSGSFHVTSTASDAMGFFLNHYSNDQLQNGILQNAGATTSWGPTVNAGAGSGSFHLPLPCSWLDQMYMNENDVNGDILIHLHTQAPVRVGAAAFTCSGCAFIAQSDRISAKDSQQTHALVRNNIMSRVFLEPVRQEYLNVPMAAGVTTRLDCDGFGRGNCAAIIVMLRNAGLAGLDLINYVRPGDGCLIDFKSASNSSIYGAGQPQRYDYLQGFVFPQHFDSNYNRNQQAIVIPFCDDLHAALNGVRSGGFQVLDASKAYVSITPAAIPAGNYDIVAYALMFKMRHKRAPGAQISVENA